MPTEGPNISVALVSPWMDQGTLFKYLERNPKVNRTQLVSRSFLVNRNCFIDRADIGRGSRSELLALDATTCRSSRY